MIRAVPDRFFPLLAVALLAGYYAILLGPLTFSRGVWVNDEGNRMLQIEAFAGGSGYLRDPLGGTILPGLAPFAPGGYMVREPEQHRIVSGYSEPFPYLSARLYRIGGFPLCRFAVLLAGLGCAMITGQLLRNAGAGPRCTAAGILLTGGATPLLFYSGTLLEITFAALLTSLTFLLLQTAWKSRHRIFWTGAGLLAAMVPWFREEGYVIGAAALLALLIPHPKKNRLPACLFAAGFLPGTAALLIFNHVRYDTIFGLHHLIYREIQPAQKTVGSVLRSIWFFLFEPVERGIPGIFCAALCLAVLLIPILLLFLKKAAPQKKDPEDKIFPVISVLLTAAAAVNAFFLCSARSPLELTLSSQSICATVPFVLFPVLFARRIFTGPDPFPAFLLRTALLASAGIAFLLEYNTRGMFFGPRHFVPLLPLFAVPAVLSMRDVSSRTIRCAFLAVCLISALCQFRGAILLRERKAFGSELNEICRASSVPLILTDAFFIPEELASLGGSPPVLWIGSEGIRPFRILTDLNGVDRFLFLSGEHFSDAPDLIPSLSPDWHFKKQMRIEYPDLSMLALNIYLAARKDDHHGR